MNSEFRTAQRRSGDQNSESSPRSMATGQVVDAWS
jgi:hypothetical protein